MLKILLNILWLNCEFYKKLVKNDENVNYRRNMVVYNLFSLKILETSDYELMFMSKF